MLQMGNMVESQIYKVCSMNNTFDNKSFLTMVFAIVIIVGIIAIFSIFKSNQKINKTVPVVREDLNDIVN